MSSDISLPQNVKKFELWGQKYTVSIDKSIIDQYMDTDLFEMVKAAIAKTDHDVRNITQYYIGI